MYHTFISGSSLSRDIQLSGAADCCREKKGHGPDASLPVAEPWKAANRHPALLPAPKGAVVPAAGSPPGMGWPLQSSGSLGQSKSRKPALKMQFFYYAVDKFEQSVSFFKCFFTSNWKH